MNKAEQKQKISEFITRGELIGEQEINEFAGVSQVKGSQYETWMSEISVFNERHLKDHPLYSDIHSAFFHRNTSRKSYQNMMGHLKALVTDTDYWGEPQQDTESKPKTVLPIKKGTERHMTPIIFISHRTIDAEIADMLKDYLVTTGIPNNYIFCSSLPGNDVNSVISREVKEKIANSSVNIAILSSSYYESAYCINEAGIIWLQDPDVPAVVIGLPEIDNNIMHGFLNSDYKLRRLDNLSDISAIHDSVHTAVNVPAATLSVATEAGQKLSNRYKGFVSQRESKGRTVAKKSADNGSEDDQRSQPPLEKIKKLLINPDDWVEEDSRYYHSLYPEYTIVLEEDREENGLWSEGNKMFYHHLQTDTAAYYGTIKIFSNGMQLFSCQSTDLDGHRMTAPCPEMAFIPYRNYNDPNICLRYYVTSELRYLLLRFLEHHIGDANGREAQIATRRLLEVVLLFDCKDDVENFVTYVSRHLGSFDSKVASQREPYIENETDTAKKVLAQEIRNAQALKEMQPEWIKFKTENEEW